MVAQQSECGVMGHRTQADADAADRLARNEPLAGDCKWTDHSEYKWDGTVWYATGVHTPGWTNTPRAGEPEGLRDRKQAEPLANPIADLIAAAKPYDKARLLDTAKETVAGRGKNYGTPEDNFGRIAAHWNAFLINRHQVDEYPQDSDFLSAGDVAVMMCLMKIARLENDPAHADSWIDLAGYAACGAEIETAK